MNVERDVTDTVQDPRFIRHHLHRFGITIQHFNNGARFDHGRVSSKEKIWAMVELLI